MSATFCRLYYRVPFSETDAMGIVHHSNHARYLERGRVELLRLADCNYLEVTKRGFHIPLTDIEISFKRPLTFDQVLLIETRVSAVTRARVNFAYRIFAVDALALPVLAAEAWPGNPLVTGETFHCCVNAEGRPVEVPEDLRAALTKLQGQA